MTRLLLAILVLAMLGGFALVGWLVEMLPARISAILYISGGVVFLGGALLSVLDDVLARRRRKRALDALMKEDADLMGEEE